MHTISELGRCMDCVLCTLAQALRALSPAARPSSGAAHMRAVQFLLQALCPL